jgi:hypothetical protein
MTHDVFVSYSSKDKETAVAICESLEKDGIHCWIAPRDIQPGMAYADAIIDALNACRVFLVILSEDSNSSPQVRREVERAVSKDLTILTFRIDNTILSKAMEYYLSDRHWLDASNSAFSKQLHSLSEAIRKLLGEPAAFREKANATKPVEFHQPSQPVPQVVEMIPPKTPTVVPARTHKKRSRGWLWAACLALVVLVGISYFALTGQTNLPFFYQPTPTYTIYYAATAHARSITQTAVWINNFAEPILSQMTSRSPDLQDDFSDLNRSISYWGFFEGITIENNQAELSVSDQWQGLGLKIVSSDFAFSYTLILTDFSTTKPTMGLSFRENGAEKIFTHFTMNFNDHWCGIGEGGDAGRGMISSECELPDINIGQSNKVVIIAQGKQAAVYFNDQLLVYSNQLLPTGNNLMSLGGSVSQGTASLAIDNVKIWYLK